MTHLYKNKLQNHAQKRYLTLPEYSSEIVGPPHSRQFKSKVIVDGKTFESSKFFSSLKQSENEAAKIALESISIHVGQEDEVLYKNLLQELAQKQRVRLPAYETSKSGPSHMPTFISSVEIFGERFQGHEAKTKRLAEVDAAKVAYTNLLERQFDSGAEGLHSAVSTNGELVKNEILKFAAESILLHKGPEVEVLYKSLLQELTQKWGLRLPSYETNRSGPPHIPTFRSTVEISGERFQGNEAKTRRLAEVDAAKSAYTILLERQAKQLASGQEGQHQVLSSVEEVKESSISSKRHRCSPSSENINNPLQGLILPSPSSLPNESTFSEKRIKFGEHLPDMAIPVATPSNDDEKVTIRLDENHKH